MNIVLNPATEALKLNIEVLKNELTSIINDYELLVNFVCRNIQDKYMTLIGFSKLQLLNLECDCRKLKRKIELIQRCINTGEPVIIQDIDYILDFEMKEWYVKINQHLSEL